MRILIAEDDDTTALLLARVLSRAGHELVRAKDGLEALNQVRGGGAFDAIVTDWMMPHMDGVQFIQAMRRDLKIVPPIVVVTAIASNEAREQTLEAGADEYLAKPVQPQELLHCLESVVARHKQTWSAPPTVEPNSAKSPVGLKLSAPLVVLTAGTGGPVALQKIFRSLRQGHRASFLIVQQGPTWMLETFAHRLQTRTPLPVALARDGEQLAAGRVRIAPGDVHCVLDERKTRLRLVDTAPANFLRPSADVLFRSAARFGEQCIGVILSGMGCDGAMGAELMRMMGARILVQDPASAEVASMPQTAVDHGKPDAVLRVEQMSAVLDEWIIALQPRTESSNA
jgi:two-component system chemotaxis response regulator CheB